MRRAPWLVLTLPLHVSPAVFTAAAADWNEATPVGRRAHAPPRLPIYGDAERADWNTLASHEGVRDVRYYLEAGGKIVWRAIAEAGITRVLPGGETGGTSERWLRH